jgi:hypothetical protein
MGYVHLMYSIKLIPKYTRPRLHCGVTHLLIHDEALVREVGTPDVCTYPIKYQNTQDLVVRLRG